MQVELDLVFPNIMNVFFVILPEQSDEYFFVKIQDLKMEKKFDFSNIDCYDNSSLLFAKI